MRHIYYNIETANYWQMGRRTSQQDALSPSEPSAQCRLFVVCDGVGGMEGGQQASNRVCQLLEQSARRWANGKSEMTERDIQKLISGLYEQMGKEPEDTGATTLTMLQLNPNGAVAVHIGDSRIYHIRPNEGVLFRSRDHSLVADYIEAGLITEEEAKEHPQRNLITKAVRAMGEDEPQPKPAIDRITDVRVGDVFLLCTDGVWDEVDDKTIVDTLTSGKPLGQRMAELADMTKDSKDNNTAYAIEITGIKKREWWRLF